MACKACSSCDIRLLRCQACGTTLARFRLWAYCPLLAAANLLMVVAVLITDLRRSSDGFLVVLTGYSLVGAVWAYPMASFHSWINCRAQVRDEEGDLRECGKGTTTGHSKKHRKFSPVDQPDLIGYLILLLAASVMIALGGLVWSGLLGGPDPSAMASTMILGVPVGAMMIIPLVYVFQRAFAGAGAVGLSSLLVLGTGLVFESYPLLVVLIAIGFTFAVLIPSLYVSRKASPRNGLHAGHNATSTSTR